MYSEEHLLYIKNMKRRKKQIKICQFAIIIILLSLWEILAKYKIINTFIFSCPSLVIKTIFNLHQTGNLYQHVAITLYETIISFGLATILGIIISSILWWNKFIADTIDPYLTIINSLPKVALGPIILIWGGAGIKSIIIMALLISLIITIIAVYNGFNNTNTNQIKLLKSFGATKWQIYVYCILPGNVPTIINALKVNISMSLIGVIMGEFLVSKNGIGYLIMYGSQVFNLTLVISGIFILCLVATALYMIINIIEKKYTLDL